MTVYTMPYNTTLTNDEINIKIKKETKPRHQLLSITE